MNREQRFRYVIKHGEPPEAAGRPREHVSHRGEKRRRAVIGVIQQRQRTAGGVAVPVMPHEKARLGLAVKR